MLGRLGAIELILVSVFSLFCLGLLPGAVGFLLGWVIRGSRESRKDDATGSQRPTQPCGVAPRR